MENKEKLTYIAIGFLFIVCIGLAFYIDYVKNQDDGEYDYCISWIGFSNGTISRGNLLFTCYNIATADFYCDYKIDENTQILEIKNILNVTKNDEGGIIEIIYDEPNYFECKRWLKSKHLNN